MIQLRAPQPRPAVSLGVPGRFARCGQGLWQPAAHSFGVPHTLHSWLFDDGSLTAKLRKRSAGQLQVQVLRQYWGRPTLSERRTLLSSGAALIREVLLLGPDNVPWVYARSVFPAASLTGKLRHLRKLANRPLGGFLFSHRQLGRSAMQIAQLPPHEHLVPPEVQGNDMLWGRRSKFFLFGKTLLVSEVFLPALIDSRTLSND
ncbi:chorismate--pyruvate lyase family protein [Gilvimarinus polysaccharolyticus]|uniref:chorismate--pyruvate lyase family protein n=1 Tax=Gilvimarinus polysaccharolyticus TaxID=863921 RepID=UPI00067396E8|nr:chorismate lyase [Gilvimarinus polysaccharolyticus]